LCRIGPGIRRHHFHRRRGASGGGAVLFGWAGALLGFFIPYAYASHMRTRRFQKFEEKFPRPSIRSPAPFAPDTHLPPPSK